MRIEELDEVESDGREIHQKEKECRSPRMMIVRVDAKRALVGAGARILFYPTLLYNVFRNKVQAEFRWWDEVDQVIIDSVFLVSRASSINQMIQFLLLGAVPFPKDVPRLKQVGVGGVVTLNEPYETLVPTSLYYAHGIDHLVIPTRDYLFAPSPSDINRAVDFIHRNACHGKTTYVHCKAGRGRSTTIVLCYLVRYKHMSPIAALEYVRSRRPRVLLAPSQWKAVQEFGNRQPGVSGSSLSSDAVLITKADLEGYPNTHGEAKELRVTSKAMTISAKPMIARLSCLLAALKVSCNNTTTAGRLPQIRAC